MRRQTESRIECFAVCGSVAQTEVLVAATLCNDAGCCAFISKVRCDGSCIERIEEFLVIPARTCAMRLFINFGGLKVLVSNELSVFLVT